MKDGKIHIPVKRKRMRMADPVVKVKLDAYEVLEEICIKTRQPMTEVVSAIIMQSKDHIVYDEEDE